VVRLRTATHLGEDNDAEAGYVEEGRKFQGAYAVVQGKDKKAVEEAAKTAALEWTDRQNTSWTGATRLLA